MNRNMLAYFLMQGQRPQSINQDDLPWYDRLVHPRALDMLHMPHPQVMEGLPDHPGGLVIDPGQLRGGALPSNGRPVHGGFKGPAYIDTTPQDWRDYFPMEKPIRNYFFEDDGTSIK